MRYKIQIGSMIYEFLPERGLPDNFNLSVRLSDLEVGLIPCQLERLFP